MKIKSFIDKGLKKWNDMEPHQKQKLKKQVSKHATSRTAKKIITEVYKINSLPSCLFRKYNCALRVNHSSEWYVINKKIVRDYI